MLWHTSRMELLRLAQHVLEKGGVSSVDIGNAILVEPERSFRVNDGVATELLPLDEGEYDRLFLPYQRCPHALKTPWEAYRTGRRSPAARDLVQSRDPVIMDMVLSARGDVVLRWSVRSI